MTASWGNYPKISLLEKQNLYWQDQSINFSQTDKQFLPYGQGRSYGDSCLNDGGILLGTAHLNRFINFDKQAGILRCESGVTFAEILDVIMPQGWFLPVVPGTKYVSLGGAIANDIHGKNHHHVGPFGRHILKFMLLRSNGERLICSPEINSELYSATIGGLGLTGLIVWAEIQLLPIKSSFLDVEYIKFSNLKQFDTLVKESEVEFDYTVAWLDCLAKGENLGRGIFMRANHQDCAEREFQAKKKLISMPFFLPSFCLNKLSITLFNKIYFNKQKSLSEKVHYEKFFFPLDSILHWNRIYGKRGFLQYQFLVPDDSGDDLIEVVMARIAESGMGSFLSVLKKFGDLTSPGLLSFPKKGTTLALDFPIKGEKTFALLNDLDKIVMSHGGRVYPAKDARMSTEAFRNYYPNWEKFLPYIDPRFSSSFWRRVMS